MTKFKIKLSFSGNHDMCMERLDAAVVGLLPELGVRKTDRVFPGTEVKRTVSLSLSSVLDVRLFISKLLNQFAQDDFLSLRVREIEFSTKDQLDFPIELSGTKFISAQATRDDEFSFSSYVDVPYSDVGSLSVTSMDVYHYALQAPAFRVLSAVSGFPFMEVKESRSVFRSALQVLLKNSLVSEGQTKGEYAFAGFPELVRFTQGETLADVVKVYHLLGVPDYTEVHFANPDLLAAEFLGKVVRIDCSM